MFKNCPERQTLSLLPLSLQPVAYPGTPVGALFPHQPQGRFPASRQVISPTRLAEPAAAAGANPAQPAPVFAGQAHHEGFCQGSPDERPLYPAMRFVHERTQLIHGEEESWADRIVVEERRNHEEVENLNRMQAQLTEKQFFFYCHRKPGNRVTSGRRQKGPPTKPGIGLLSADFARTLLKED